MIRRVNFEVIHSKNQWVLETILFSYFSPEIIGQFLSLWGWEFASTKGYFCTPPNKYAELLVKNSVL